MGTPTDPRREAIVRTWATAKANGKTLSEADLLAAVPTDARSILGSTYRLLVLYEASGARSVKSLRKWQAAQTDESLKKGFGTGEAHQVVRLLYPTAPEDTEDAKDAEPMEPQRVDVEPTPSQAGGQDQSVAGNGKGTERSVARVDASTLDVFEQWKDQLRAERAEGAKEARAHEREIAEARAAAARANARLGGVVAAVFALVAGIVIGVAYARSTPSTAAVPHGEGVHAAPGGTDTPPPTNTPTPTAAPTAPSVTPATPEVVPKSASEAAQQTPDGNQPASTPGASAPAP